MAKMLRTILSKEWETKEECKEYYKSVYTDPTISATYNTEDISSNVLCIAFADQLKNICATIFGIPIARFYGNKSTAWICINQNFEYTEIKPNESFIITAEDYYNDISSYRFSDDKYWMSLREILVYVGTYVLQQDINKSIFVNVVRNLVKEKSFKNKHLKYVIISDLRFCHEVDFIKENNGLMITIQKDSVKQLDNVAEHDLDDELNYDYIIDNNGSYDELFDQIWDMVHTDVEFRNQCIALHTREDDINNYLRLYQEEDNIQIWKLCGNTKMQRLQRLQRQDSEIISIDCTGGPEISLGKEIDIYDDDILIPIKIELTDNNNILIHTENKTEM